MHVVPSLHGTFYYFISKFLVDCGALSTTKTRKLQALVTLHGIVAAIIYRLLKKLAHCEQPLNIY